MSGIIVVDCIRCKAVVEESKAVKQTHGKRTYRYLCLECNSRLKTLYD